MAKRLVVIGGVAGGTSAASRARRVDPKLEIILFEQGPHVSYSACDEPYFLAGIIPSSDRLLVRSPEAFRAKQNIDIRLHHQAMALDPQRRAVEVRDQSCGRTSTYEWDSLVIATGARPRALAVAGADAPNLFQLKSLQSAIALKRFLDQEKPKRAVTYGAGFIALEMAEAFAGQGLSNTILHKGGQVGGRLEPEIAAKVTEVLDERGVPYVNRVELQGFERDRRGSIRAVLTNRGRFEADLVLASIGVVPNVELAAAAGVKLGGTGAIAVDPRQETNLKGIFSAGDCCESYHRISRAPVYFPLGDLANKQGWTAGENAAGGNLTYPGPLGSWHFKCFDLEVAVTGLLASEAERAGFDPVTTRITQGSRTHAQPGRREILVQYVVDRKTHRLLGAQMAGKDGVALRIHALSVALFKEMTVEELAEVDLAYSPPFSPVIDPILIAARVASKQLSGKQETE